MSKRQFLCLLGVWVIVFLFLGLPTPWLRVLAVVTGLIIIGLAYSFPPPTPRAPFGNRETFEENEPK